MQDMKKTRHGRRRTLEKDISSKIIRPKYITEERDEKKEALKRHRGTNIIFSSSDIPKLQCIYITYEV